MSARHTPWPWHVQAGMVVARDARRTIAITTGSGAVRFADAQEERAANAAVIAAAPEMLDFARNVGGMDRARIQTCADVAYLRGLLIEFQDIARSILRAAKAGR